MIGRPVIGTSLAPIGPDGGSLTPASGVGDHPGVTAPSGADLRFPPETLLRAELEQRVAFADRIGNCHGSGAWRLLLGDPGGGIEAMRRCVAVPPEPERSLVDVELAVVAGEWDRAVAAARLAVGGPTDRHVAGFRPFLRGLLSAISGDDGALRGHLLQADREARGKEHLASRHPTAVLDILRGLADGDAATIDAGLDALLSWHARRARSRSEIFNSDRGVVAWLAVVAILVAHHRALRVTVSRERRHAVLPFLLVHLESFEGVPLPRALQLSARVDLVAAPWLRAQGVEIDELPPVEVG